MNIADVTKWEEDLIKKALKGMKHVTSINLSMKQGRVPILTVEKLADPETPEIIKFINMVPWAQPVLPSEYLYAFVGWLTTREETVKIGAKETCGVWAELVYRFCEENELQAPRDHFEKNILHPKEK